MAANWFINEMARGISTLCTLNLPGRPAADLVEEAIVTWSRALWPKAVWDAMRDTPRIREAFNRAGGEALEFPTPRMVFDLLPPVAYTRAALPPPRRTGPTAHAARCIAEIREMLDTMPEGHGFMSMDGTPINPLDGGGR